MTESDVEAKFAPVFALKVASNSLRPDAKPLNSHDRRKAWGELTTKLPAILSKCSGIDLHPDSDDYPEPLQLWDFFNGREICVSVNERGGYNLSIRAEEVRWLETQLSLDLLFLKLLALDYTPEEFRVLAG